MNTMPKDRSDIYNKLPLITFYFWVVKICATTLGETGGDLFAQTLKVGYATTTIVLMSLFFIALIFQLLSQTYKPLLYWSVILLTSTAGTTMSDFMDRTLQLGYAKGSAILVTSLAAVLLFWRWSEGSLSVDHVRSRKAEFFYWIAILVSNTLGTAVGDFLADSSGLGFGGGAALIGTLLAAVTLCYFFTKISHVGLFWAAFILTRPFGATIGDFLTKEKGGLNLGTVNSSFVLIGVMLTVLVYTMWKKNLHSNSGESVLQNVT